MPTQIRKINEPIDRPQHVIGRHKLVEAKFVEKALLHNEPITHHRPNLPAATAQENHSRGTVASTFFNEIRHKRPFANFRAQALTAAIRELTARRSDKPDRTAVNAEYIPCFKRGRRMPEPSPSP